MVEYITDIFLVTGRDSDIQTVILDKTTRGQDSNLYETSWTSRSKSKRFIGFRRNVADEYVVTDMMVINEDKDIPDDYAGCHITNDTREKGLRKHILCYKRDSRDSAERALTEINVISKGEPVPPMYTSISTQLGENQLVFKVEDIKRPLQAAPQLAPLKVNEVPQVQHQALDMAGSPGSPISGLAGVPFELNPMFDKNASVDSFIRNITTMSVEEISSKYNYSFHLEEAVVSNG